MVSKGLAGDATLVMALASAGAFAPGKAFLRNPLMPSSHGIHKVVRVENGVTQSSKVSPIESVVVFFETNLSHKLILFFLLCYI